MNNENLKNVYKIYEMKTSKNTRILKYFKPKKNIVLKQ